MINSRRYYCRSNRVAFRELDSFAQDVSEVRKRSQMFNTRWKTAEGLPNKNGSCAGISSTSGDVVAARWRRAGWRRAPRARAISKRACQEQFYNHQAQQPAFVFWRETFSSTFSSGAKMSRAFACADQRLMASPLRQTSHSAMHRGFLPPFFFCGCWCNFFHRPLAEPGDDHRQVSSCSAIEDIAAVELFTSVLYLCRHLLALKAASRLRHLPKTCCTTELQCPMYSATVSPGCFAMIKRMVQQNPK